MKCEFFSLIHKVKIHPKSLPWWFFSVCGICLPILISVSLCMVFFLSLGDLAPSYLISFFTFLFCIGIKPMNSVVTVSGGQQRDLATHVHVSILP